MEVSWKDQEVVCSRVEDSNNEAELKSLPEELIQSIFSLLSFEDRLTARRTCKDWQFSIFTLTLRLEKNKVDRLLGAFLQEQPFIGRISREKLESLKVKNNEIEIKSFKELKEHHFRIRKFIYEMLQLESLDLIINYRNAIHLLECPLYFNVLLDGLNVVYSYLNDFYEAIHANKLNHQEGFLAVIRLRNLVYESLDKCGFLCATIKFKRDNLLTDFRGERAYVLNFENRLSLKKYDEAFYYLQLISPFGHKKDEYKIKLMSKLLKENNFGKAKEIASTIINRIRRESAFKKIEERESLVI